MYSFYGISIAGGGSRHIPGHIQLFLKFLNRSNSSVCCDHQKLQMKCGYSFQSLYNKYQSYFFKRFDIGRCRNDRGPGAGIFATAIAIAGISFMATKNETVVTTEMTQNNENQSSTRDSLHHRQRSTYQPPSPETSMLGRKRILFSSIATGLHRFLDEGNQPTVPEASGKVLAWYEMAWTLMDLTGENDKDSRSVVNGAVKAKEQILASLISQMHDKISFVKEFAGQWDGQEALDMVSDHTRSGSEIMSYCIAYHDDLIQVAKTYLGDIDLSRLSPIALFYFYFEHNVAGKGETNLPQTVSLRDRKDGRIVEVMKTIDQDEIKEWLEAARWMQLSTNASTKMIHEYVDSLNKKHKMASNGRALPLNKVISCDMNSKPGQPAHFMISVPREDSALFQVANDSSITNDVLSVILVIRGTQSIADVITDLLCNETQYGDDNQTGMAHAYILESGQFIVEKHHNLLLDLCNRTGHKSVELVILGHSLGAGAAAMAGLEWNTRQDPRIRISQVIGFGCPAILSLDLAEQCQSFVTTVVHDEDMIPRVSGITMTNLLLDVLTFDWVPFAKRDIQNALAELQDRQRRVFDQHAIANIKAMIYSLLESVQQSNGINDLPSKLPCRASVALFPPGKCVHLYRNGPGMSCRLVPNSFYSDVLLSPRMITGKDVMALRMFLTLKR